MSYLDIVKLGQKNFGFSWSRSRSLTKNMDGVGVGVKKVDSAGHYWPLWLVSVYEELK